ncbi:iron-containing redox enzyme family protein [Nocardia alni]|uniref:iron-containing redox enzyme family protein n=1 Tax=Nocardia alni TaxID=2815723 RepID=UPI001C24B3D2|nr:iron-containing redox enzyme family protein [Nocardia alni]
MNPVSDEDELDVPGARGPISAAVHALLAGDRQIDWPDIESADPYGEDLHLALHNCYELAYRGFTSVDADMEWDLELLELRARMEKHFESALRRDVPGGADLAAELETLVTEPAEAAGISEFLRTEGEWWHIREYFAHRSIYHHKEADPYIWAVPRLRGQAKAALVAVEYDEFGAGRAERVHARLFAELLAGAGLNSGYLHYLNQVPAPMLALVNMMSLFGLHRSLRGALVGHFATVEITSPPGSRRMVQALRRLDADPACVLFYTEHVEADAVHEQIMRRDVLGDLLRREPQLTESVVFGIQVTNLLEDRFEQHVLHDNWRAARTSLREPLPDPDAPARPPVGAAD